MQDKIILRNSNMEEDPEGFTGNQMEYYIWKVFNIGLSPTFLL